MKMTQRTKGEKTEWTCQKTKCHRDIEFKFHYRIIFCLPYTAFSQLLGVSFIQQQLKNEETTIQVSTY